VHSAEWDADDRRSYRLADVDAELGRELRAGDCLRDRSDRTGSQAILSARPGHPQSASLNDLCNDPAPAQVKALAGSGGLFRIRVGDWRIIDSIERDHARVVIVDIGHRSTVYRRRSAVGDQPLSTLKICVALPAAFRWISWRVGVTSTPAPL